MTYRTASGRTGVQEFTDRLLEEMEKLEFGWRQETGE